MLIPMTTTQPEWDIKIGEHYRINDPRAKGIWKVVQLLPKNLRMENVDTGAISRVSRELLLPVSPEHERPSIGLPYATEIPLPELYVVGETVKLRGKPGVFVILKSTPRGYSVAQLGGDRDKYYNAPESLLSRVKITWTEDQS